MEMQTEADETHLRVLSNSISGAFLCKYTLAFLRDYLCVGPELSFKALQCFVPLNNTIMEAILKEHLSCFFYLYKSYSFVAFRKYFFTFFYSRLQPGSLKLIASRHCCVKLYLSRVSVTSVDSKQVC